MVEVNVEMYKQNGIALSQLKTLLLMISMGQSGYVRVAENVATWTNLLERLSLAS